MWIWLLLLTLAYSLVGLANGLMWAQGRRGPDVIVGVMASVIAWPLFIEKKKGK